MRTAVMCLVWTAACVALLHVSNANVKEAKKAAESARRSADLANQDAARAFEYKVQAHEWRQEAVINAARTRALSDQAHAAVRAAERLVEGKQPMPYAERATQPKGD